MTDSNFPFGYCTNVHAGPSLEKAKANLLQFASRVQTTVADGGKLPVGLWLAEDAASLLDQSREAGDFAEWLSEHRFLPYTLNGFPQGDFHQDVVKHAVYSPDWRDPRRMRYTQSLARTLSVLLPENGCGSISTLPLGWPHETWFQDDFQQAAKHLLEVAGTLRELAEATGRKIVLAIEPEPGCLIDTAGDMVQFFNKYLLHSADTGLAREFLTVCHDMCHSSVMFEPQHESLQQYLDAGIRVGKTQVSSAVHVAWDLHRAAESDYLPLLQQLHAFDEPKYLHQTTRSGVNGDLTAMADDLPLALDQWANDRELREFPWRVHFHVPIFVPSIGPLDTTQSDIRVATEYLESHRTTTIDGNPWFVGHYEVETYAWPVLPASLAVDDLAVGISRELEYFQQLLGDVNSTLTS
jgi:hypothetical protein